MEIEEGKKNGRTGGRRKRKKDRGEKEKRESGEEKNVNRRGWEGE